MNSQTIAHYRLLNQQIAATRFTTPGQVVSWLGAMQAQDYAGAKWSIGLRLPNATDADIEQAIADKTIVRTWPMRGTLHFVASEDIRWMLELMTPRIIAGSAGRHRQLELDETIFAHSKDLFATALQGDKRLTRQEMMAVLEDDGIATGGQRGYHILWWAAQHGFICFGPMQGKQQTFVWLDDWLPARKQLTRDEALAELATRYFTGHGPATVPDFMWWTGLTAADAKAALALAKSQLIHEEVAGQTYWLVENSPSLPNDKPDLYLLPGFDEYMLGYKDRSAILDPSHVQKITPGNNGMFSPTIVIDGRVVGTWKRTFKKDTVTVTLKPFTRLSEADSQAIAVAVERYRVFVNRLEAVQSVLESC